MKFKALVFLLAGLFLFAEFALFQHAIKHQFTDTDEICFVCEKADHFENTLLAADLSVPGSAPARLDIPVPFPPRLAYLHFHFHARGPPVSSLDSF